MFFNVDVSCSVIQFMLQQVMLIVVRNDRCLCHAVMRGVFTVCLKSEIHEIHENHEIQSLSRNPLSN